MDDLTSRAEAIDILKRMSTNHFYGHREQEALKLGAEALSAERREVQSSECEYWDDESNFCTLNRPSSERRGRWIDHSDEWDGGYYECSVCGEAFAFIEGTPKENNYRYCPDCGTRMEV